MTDQELFESWISGKHAKSGPLRGIILKPDEAWHAALAWLRSQGEPVGEVMHLHELNDAWVAGLPVGTKLYAVPQPAIPASVKNSIGTILTQVMDLAAANGANSVSMPDEYVEVAAWLCGVEAHPAIPDGWQPIETAPKDGTVFWGYAVPEADPYARGPRQAEVYWDTDLDAWNSDGLTHWHQVTHWSPLLSGPEPTK